MDDLKDWTVDTICQWMDVIGERSDRVISSAMASDDWSDHDSDERMYQELSAELTQRGLKYTGNGVEWI